MSLKRRPQDPMMPDDPSAAGLGDQGLMGADPAALGDPLGGLPTDAQAALPPTGPEAGTGGLSNEELANLDLSAALPDNSQLPGGTDTGVDPHAADPSTLEDPAVAQLLDALNNGDPEAMQILDLAARRRLAGA